MKARYVQRGESIDFTPTSDVAAGDVVKLGKLTGVAKLDIKSGELGALALVGVYELAVKSGKTFTAGQVAYYDPATGDVTPAAPADGSEAFALGHVVAAVSASETTAHIRLAQGL